MGGWSTRTKNKARLEQSAKFLESSFGAYHAAMSAYFERFPEKETVVNSVATAMDKLKDVMVHSLDDI